LLLCAVLLGSRPLPLSIDISCLPGPQQQTCRSRVRRRNDGRYYLPTGRPAANPLHPAAAADRQTDRQNTLHL